MKVINFGNINSSISINGRDNVVMGNINSNGNVCISNGKVIINGVDMTPNDKIINIVINGNVEDLQIDVCNRLDINGYVNGYVKCGNGDTHIEGNVSGNASSTNGAIECGGVGGDVETTNGNIKCKDVRGAVKSINGNITHNVGSITNARFD